MITAVRSVPVPENEPVLSYAPGSSERREVRGALSALDAERVPLTSVIGGEVVSSKNPVPMSAPHCHERIVGELHPAGENEVMQAIGAAQGARAKWASMSFEDRASVFLKAADLLAGRYRARANAMTMLGQSKTVHQAEIDAACELIDFWRFNVHYARRILEDQPLSAPGIWNQSDYRPLDGFVLAVTPFNFTSITGNLPSAPALMGNTVVWKPATAGALGAQVVMDILLEAGLPRGVINLVHAPGRVVGETALVNSDLAGVHFTGSTATFQSMWSTVGQNIQNYRCYPRLVGETGGKDFVFAHPSADVETLSVALVRGAFEYQGQKCSAASRAYVPKSLWPELSARLEALVGALKVGAVEDFSNFMGAVIDRRAYDKIESYIEYARSSSDARVWLGGGCDDSVGYFVQPTVVVTNNPRHRLMVEEIFGPVLTVYCYDDAKLEEALGSCDSASPYALTGAVFAQDRQVIASLTEKLRYAAGNFYINDKPTGAVVGQQPFGGSRASGTNDKAGSMLNLLRWTSPRTIKETFDAPRSVEYPFMVSDNS